MENEANLFAVLLLLPDKELDRHKEYTTGQIARIYGYSEKLIELRFKHKKG